MNKREKQILIIVYDCMNRISGMYPSNPADQKAKMHYLDRINKASGHLVLAISSIGFRDYESAIESAREAAEVLDLEV